MQGVALWYGWLLKHVQVCIVYLLGYMLSKRSSGKSKRTVLIWKIELSFPFDISLSLSLSLFLSLSPNSVNSSLYCSIEFGNE